MGYEMRRGSKDKTRLVCGEGSEVRQGRREVRVASLRWDCTTHKQVAIFIRTH